MNHVLSTNPPFDSVTIEALDEPLRLSFTSKPDSLTKKSLIFKGIEAFQYQVALTKDHIKLNDETSYYLSLRKNTISDS